MNNIQWNEMKKTRWKNGTEPVRTGWYAGKQYDGDVARAHEILQNLSQYVTEIAPGAAIEISGFFFWQGDRDRYVMICCCCCCCLNFYAAVVLPLISPAKSLLINLFLDIGMTMPTRNDIKKI
jgi:hypothetical protein